MDGEEFFDALPLVGRGGAVEEVFFGEDEVEAAGGVVRGNVE